MTWFTKYIIVTNGRLFAVKRVRKFPWLCWEDEYMMGTVWGEVLWLHKSYRDHCFGPLERAKEWLALANESRNDPLEWEYKE